MEQKNLSAGGGPTGARSGSKKGKAKAKPNGKRKGNATELNTEPVVKLEIATPPAAANCTPGDPSASAAATLKPTLKQTAALYLTAQPSAVVNGTLRDYQLDGVNWLIHMYQTGVSAILVRAKALLRCWLS